MKFPQKWIIVGGTSVVLVGSILFWQSNIEAKKHVQIFETPQRRTLEQNLEFSGKVDAKEKATLKFLAGGKITYLGAKVGDQVRKGQTVASVDKRDLLKNLQKELNDYMIERFTVEQNRENRKDVSGNASIDRLNAEDQFTLNNTVLDVELKDIALRNASLYSPVTGILISAPTEIVGTIVSATDMFQIVNLHTMVFVANIDEADIAKLKENMRAIVKLDAYPSLTIPVKVNRISYQSSETSTGTVFPVEFDLPSTYNTIQYRLGMNGSVRILIDRKESVLSIPIRAVIERDDKYYVEIQGADGKAIQKEIEIGLENDDYVELKSGLQESDKVLVR